MASMSDDLYPALLQTFGIILLGFLAARFRLFSVSETRGLNNFGGLVALPSLIFVSLCQLDLSNIEWPLILGIFVAKLVLFVSVFVTTMVCGGSLGRAAIYAMFVTQSNDFALGYPIMMSVFRESRPQFPNYLYILAPTNLAILNPMALVSLELASMRSSGQEWSTRRFVGKIVLNPIISMTFLGLMANLVFKGQVPALLQPLLSTLGNAFSSVSLFVLGLNMDRERSSSNGQSSSRPSRLAILTPLTLSLLKVLVLPLVSREFVSHIPIASSDVSSLANFAFLYGTIPTAPGVFIYASQYNLDVDIVAQSLITCTFVAAPIMFVSARLLSVTNVDPYDYVVQVHNFMGQVSCVGLVSALYVLFVLLITKKFRRLPQALTFLLTLSQAVNCVGGLIWAFSSTELRDWTLYTQFVLFAFGSYSSRLMTAFLAITMLVIQWRPAAITFHKYMRVMIVVGLLLPLFIVMLLVIVVREENEDDDGKKLNPNFQYGKTQAWTSSILTLICLIVTLASSILGARLRQKQPAALHKGTEDQDQVREALLPDEELVTEVEYLGRQSGQMPLGTNRELEDEIVIENMMDSSSSLLSAPVHYLVDDGELRSFLRDAYEVPEERGRAEDFEEDMQIEKHNLLLLMLITSMFIGTSFCLWSVVSEKRTAIFVELLFMDTFFLLGQPLFSLALFAFEPKYVWLTLRHLFQHLLHTEGLRLPSEVDSHTLHVCHQFRRHHLEHCKTAIAVDVDGHREELYREAFLGRTLVDWMLEIGLAQDRVEALHYGRRLVEGRVLRHVEDSLDFYDDFFLYTFRERRDS